MQDINIDVAPEVLYATYYAPAEAPVIDIPPAPSGSPILTINGVITGPSVTFSGGSSGFSYTAVGTTTLNLTSPLTTKGDIYTWSSSGTRLAVGANGTVLTADSGETTGIKWATPTASAPTNAQYVTLATDATLTAERVLTGTANQVVLTDAGAGSTLTLSLPQSIATSSTPQFARIGLGAAAHASDLLLLSGAATELRIIDTTASSGMQSTIGSNSGFGGWTANRDFVSGTIPDSGKASAMYLMFVGNADSYHAWYTGSANNTSPTQRMQLTAVGNLKIAGTASRGTTEGTAQLVIFNGTAPAGTLTDGVAIYSASGKLKSADAAGTIGHVLSASAVSVVSPTAQNRTITVDVGGTTYYISAKTTND